MTKRKSALLNGASRQIAAPPVAPPSPQAGFESMVDMIFSEEGWRDVVRFLPTNMRDQFKDAPPTETVGRYLIEAVLGSMAHKLSAVAKLHQENHHVP